MDIKRKLQIVEKAIQSISQHDDADSVTILAALERVKTMAEDQAKTVCDNQAKEAQAVILEQ